MILPEVDALALSNRKPPSHNMRAHVSPPFYDENPFGIYQKVLAGRIDFRKHLDVKQWKSMSLEFKKEYAKWSVRIYASLHI